MSAPLRLINTAWVYDNISKTLFTSDMFTYGVSQNSVDTWILEKDDLFCESQFIKSFMSFTSFYSKLVFVYKSFRYIRFSVKKYFAFTGTV